MSIDYGERGERVYDDGRTKQAFKDSTDINKMSEGAASWKFSAFG